MKHGLWLIGLLLAGCDAKTPNALGTSQTQPLVVSLSDTGGELRLGASHTATPIRLEVTTNSGDMAYRTNWALQTGSCLRVVPRAGEPIVLSGAPIVVDYFHSSRTLGVAIGPANGAQRLLGFAEPVSWETVTCPPAPPSGGT